MRSASWQRVIEALTGEVVPRSRRTMPFATTRRLAFDRDSEAALITSLTLARDNARQVREALSNEVWENLNRLYLRLSPVTMDAIWVHTPARLFREALEEMHALEGVTYSTLSHGEGWYFLELGKHIERVQLIGRLLDVHFGAVLPGRDGRHRRRNISTGWCCCASAPPSRPIPSSIPPRSSRRKSRNFFCSIPNFPIRSAFPSNG